ncbi:marine proteobacterial sortase target protein [Pelagibius marinus]|uniref:marine proteobacterial sortase target protein n=1 Tax=Pelagibius marinus TaxID=2762760 RepID=UPI001872965E|nr:marine proteobacterial sortase target protein [Pelagibius marinus]
MRHDLLPQPSHGLFPPRLGRAVFRDALVIAGTLGLAILVLLASLAVHSLPAAAQSQPEELRAGLFFPSGEAGKALEAPTLKTDVDMAVNGMVNRVTVRQVFHNPTDRWLEGVYIFPLPERSAVDRLTMVIGERRIQGRILEKAEAKRVYQEAADSGQRASLVSAERPNVFATSVANIGPGEDITVEIAFQDSVAYENGVFSLRFPMVVAPRYTPAPRADIAEAPRGPQPSPAVVRQPAPGEPRDLFGPVDIDETTHNPLSLRIDLNGGVPLEGVKSLYHPVVVESGKDGRQSITLRPGPDGKAEVPADRDFVLQWTPLASAAPRAAVFAEQVGADTHLLVMMVPPTQDAAPAPQEIQGPQSIRPREVIFVIDTSGSMHGASIDQAKAAVIAALKRLNPQDRFNVIQFNNETHALFPRAAAASVGNVAQAWHYVSALEADGGTEMRPALELALAEQPEDGHLRQVVFLTDAAVSNEAELFAQVAERLGDSRLFTVGIGSAPNSYFMRKAAELGRGSFTYIGDLDEVGERVDALLTKLEQPALTGVRVGWPLSAGKRLEIYPTPLPDLYAGEPVTFAARLEGVDLAQLDGQLLITGEAATGAWQQRVPLTGLTAAPGVASIWARAKLVQIEDGLYRGRDAGGQAVDQTAIRAEALAVALKHGLVTRYTSLVAVDDAVARPRDENLNSTEIPRDLPHGWDAEKVFGETILRNIEGPSPSEEPAAGAPLQAPQEMRSRALPDYFLQQAKAADGQLVTLPQTATPAERMAIIGGAYLFMALALIVLVLRRRKQGGLRG